MIAGVLKRDTPVKTDFAHTGPFEPDLETEPGASYLLGSEPCVTSR